MEKKGAKKKPIRGKKPAKKAPTKKKKKVEKEIKKDIALAVDSLPDFVVSSVTPQRASSQEKSKPLSPSPVQYYQEPKHATLLVWVGVTTVALFIAGLWAWNARLVLSETLTRGFDEEVEIIGGVKTNFDTAIENLSATITSTVATASTAPATTTSAEENIKNVLQILLTNASSTTSTQQ